MAIDPSIILQGRPANIDVGRTFNNALLNVQGFDNLQQSREQAPLRNRLLTAQTEQAETQAETQAREGKFRNLVFRSQSILPDLQSGNIEGAMASLLADKTELVTGGTPTAETDNAIRLLQQDPTGATLREKVQEIITVGERMGVIKGPQVGTANQRDFQQLQALSEAARQSGDPAQIEQARQFGLTIGVGRESAQDLSDIRVSQAQKISDIELQSAAQKAGASAAGKAAIARSELAFDRVGKIKTNVNNLDEVISLIDQGASTGVIASKLPSVKSASIALDNLQNRLGLDVVGNTTFGALSESELAFALKTALPKNLSGPDLKKWVLRKKDAQLKLAGYLEEVASFLGTPGNTTADFIELQKVKQLDAEQGVIEQPVAQGIETLSDEQLQQMLQQAQ